MSLKEIKDILVKVQMDQIDSFPITRHWGESDGILSDSPVRGGHSRLPPGPHHHDWGRHLHYDHRDHRSEVIRHFNINVAK